MADPLDYPPTGCPPNCTLPNDGHWHVIVEPDPLDVYTVEVGYCVGYPIKPDQFLTWVQVGAHSTAEARLVACQMTMARGNYATRADIIDLVL